MAKSNEHLPVIENPDVAYEKRDVNPRALFFVLMGIIVAAVIVHFGVKTLFGRFAARDQQSGLQPSTMVRRDRMTKPPEPRLQTDPAGDLRELRAQEADTLNSYGWVDRQKGIVRIPIEQAKKLIVQRGLPAATQGSEGNQQNTEAQPEEKQEINRKSANDSNSIGVNSARVKDTQRP